MHTLKGEEVDGKDYQSREDAESKIGAFIDDVYNASGCTLRSATSRPLSSRTNSDKLRNVKQTTPCPCHRISRVSAEGRSPEADEGIKCTVTVTARATPTARSSNRRFARCSRRRRKPERAG